MGAGKYLTKKRARQELWGAFVIYVCVVGVANWCLLRILGAPFWTVILLGVVVGGMVGWNGATWITRRLQRGYDFRI